VTDVAVIGAGLAGAAAAARLAARGLAVTVIEARGRAGGRGFARPFRGSGPVLEFGGAWITPWQASVRALCARTGTALGPRTPIRERRWFRDGALHRDGPTAAADRMAHERAIARIAADAALLKLGHERDEAGRPIAGVSFAAYLARLGAPAATRDLLTAWWTVSGAADPDAAPASELLASTAYGGGLTEAMAEAWTATVDGGVQGLAGRLLAQPGIALSLGAAVTGIAHGPGGVRLRLAGGGEVAARAAIVATGLNPMAAIAFDPPLPPDRAEAIREGHAGQALKLWVEADGVPEGVLATGGGAGVEWMFADRAGPGGRAWIAGFAAPPAALAGDPARLAAEALARFFPEARMIAADWHDWNADPLARGGWVAARAGAEHRFGPDFWAPLGPLAFASSDFAARDAGWFEGAAVSGEAAADAMAALIGR
jgi:monoamine oxidase